jgi:hypothetical protein
MGRAGPHGGGRGADPRTVRRRGVPRYGSAHHGPETSGRARERSSRRDAGDAAATIAGEERRPRVPQDPGASAMRYAPESGSARLVVGQEGTRQCDGARAGQVVKSVEEPYARGRGAEHRGERGGRRDVGGEGPRRHAVLGDGAAGGAAEAARLARMRPRALTRAELARRTAHAPGLSRERREIDGHHADVRAVTAVAAPCRAGAVTGNADAGRDAVRIGRARGRRIVGAVAGRDAGAGSTCGRAVRIGRARGHPVTGAEG